MDGAPKVVLRVQKKATAGPSTAFVAQNAPNSAQDDRVLVRLTEFLFISKAAS
jgi:hypothetical protein